MVFSTEKYSTVESRDLYSVFMTWYGVINDGTFFQCVCVRPIVHLQVHRCMLLFYFFLPPHPSPVLVGTIAHVLCVSACILYE